MRIHDITNNDCQVQFFVNSIAPTEAEPDMWVGSGWYDFDNDEIIPDDGDSYSDIIDYAIWRKGELWVWEFADWLGPNGIEPTNKQEWLKCMEVRYGPSIA